MCLVSWPAQIQPQAEPRQQYIHAVDVVPTVYELLGIEPPVIMKGYEQNPIEGESFATSLTDATHPESRRSSTRCSGGGDVPRGLLACTLRPRSAAGGSSTRTSGSSTTSMRTARSRRTSPRKEPERLEQLEQLWFTEAERLDGLPLDDRTAMSRCSPSAPCRAAARALHLLARLRGRAGGGRRADQRAFVHDRRRGDGRRSPDRGGRPLCPRRRRRRTQPLREGPASSLHVQLGRHPPSEIVADRDITRATTCTPPSSQSTAGTRSGDARLRGRSRSTWTPSGSGGRIVARPSAFYLVGDGICVGRDSASPVTPDYAAPFRFTRGVIDKVIVDVTAAVHRPRGRGSRLVHQGLAGTPSCTGEPMLKLYGSGKRQRRKQERAEFHGGGQGSIPLGFHCTARLGASSLKVACGPGVETLQRREVARESRSA